MQSSMASGVQQVVTPDQRRLARKIASKDGPVELVKERSCIGGTLCLFHLRQYLFQCLRHCFRRRFHRYRRSIFECHFWQDGLSGSKRGSRWSVIVIINDARHDARLVRVDSNNQKPLTMIVNQCSHPIHTPPSPL